MSSHLPAGSTRDVCRRVLKENLERIVLDSVWIFCASTSRFPSGAFGSRELAEEWIKRHQLSGILTRYPLNEGVYDWCIRTGRFTPKEEHQSTGKFIGRFTSASQEHFHYETGINLTA